MNESSVALDPPVRTVGVLQVIQGADPLPQTGENNLNTSSKFSTHLLRVNVSNVIHKIAGDYSVVFSTGIWISPVSH